MARDDELDLGWQPSELDLSAPDPAAEFARWEENEKRGKALAAKMGVYGRKLNREEVRRSRPISVREARRLAFSLRRVSRRPERRLLRPSRSRRVPARRKVSRVAARRGPPRRSGDPEPPPVGRRLLKGGWC